MPNFSVRAALVSILFSMTTVGSIESAYAQSEKAKPKPKSQATGQIIGSSQGGCRPVALGCHLELVRTGNTGITSNVEVCK